MNNTECAACHHVIDTTAKICPYCGANPSTGEKVVDSDRLLQEVFQPREVSTSESVIEYARQRQGVFIAVAAIVTFLVLGLLHQFVTRRNATAVADAPSVPLTEITDLANRTDQTAPLPMPDLDFEYGGRPQAMQTFILEAGAVAPPEIVAAQQAAAAAEAQKRAAANPAAQPQPAAGAARPQTRPQPQRGAAPARPPAAARQ